MYLISIYFCSDSCNNYSYCNDIEGSSSDKPNSGYGPVKSNLTGKEVFILSTSVAAMAVGYRMGKLRMIDWYPGLDIVFVGAEAFTVAGVNGIAVLYGIHFNPAEIVTDPISVFKNMG